LGKEVARIAGQRVGDLLFGRVFEVRARGVAAHRHEIVTGLGQLGGMGGERVVLLIAGAGVVLHVDRHDRASRQQVLEGHLFGGAGGDNVELEVGFELLSGGNHGAATERGGRPASNGQVVLRKTPLVEALTCR